MPRARSLLSHLGRLPDADRRALPGGLSGSELANGALLSESMSNARTVASLLCAGRELHCEDRAFLHVAGDLASGLADLRTECLPATSGGLLRLHHGELRVRSGGGLPVRLDGARCSL